jgi:hypothetical protein
MTPPLLAILVFAGAALITVLGSIRLAGLGDVLNGAIGDAFYTGGSIYHAATPDQPTALLI